MTTEQVKSIRTQNESVMFNANAALLALKATPLKAARAGGGSTSDLSKHILECFKLAKGEISLNQVSAMYAKATGKEVTRELKKAISDRVWTLSDKNKKNKAPELKSGATKGCYVLAK